MRGLSGWFSGENDGVSCWLLSILDGWNGWLFALNWCFELVIACFEFAYSSVNLLQERSMLLDHDWAIGFQLEMVPFCCTVQSGCCRMDRCFLVCHLHSSVSLLQNGSMLLDQWLSYRISAGNGAFLLHSSGSLLQNGSMLLSLSSA